MEQSKPDLDEGYFRLAYSLLASLMGTPAVVGLRGVILFEVWVQEYGWAKLAFAYLDPQEIAERRGVKDASNIRRAILDLVKFGVLKDLGNRMYKFNKDYNEHDFSEDDEPRRARISYAAHAPVLVKSYKYANTQILRVNSDTPRVKTGTRRVSDLTENRVNSDTESVSILTHANPAPQTPNKERARVNSRLKETGDLVVVDADACEGRTDSTRERRDRIVALAESLRPMEGSATKIDGFIAGYGEEWTEAAVLTAMASDTVTNLWQYINKCLMRWKASGGPAPADRETILKFDAARPAGGSHLSASESRHAAMMAAWDQADFGKPTEGAHGA